MLRVMSLMFFEVESTHDSLKRHKNSSVFHLEGEQYEIFNA